MFEIIKSGGWLMAPLILCSIVAVAIAVERLWTLQTTRVAPDHLAAQAWNWLKNGELDDDRLQALRAGSPLGRILAAGLEHRHAKRDVMNEAIEDTGRHVVHELDRYLITLGTIATISPLLGLLGTVLGSCACSPPSPPSVSAILQRWPVAFPRRSLPRWRVWQSLSLLISCIVICAARWMIWWYAWNAKPCVS